MLVDILIVLLLLVSFVYCQKYHEVVGTGAGIQPGFKADGTLLYKGGKGESTIIATLQREDIFGYYNLHLYYPMRKCSSSGSNSNNKVALANPDNNRRIGQDEIIVTIDGITLKTIVFDYHNCQLYNAHFGIRDRGDYGISVIRLVGEKDLSLETPYKPELFFTKTVLLEGSEKSIAKHDQCDYGWTIIKDKNKDNNENSIPSDCKDSMKYTFWASDCENASRTDSVFGANRGIGLRLTKGIKTKIRLIGDDSMKYIGEEIRNRTCNKLTKPALCNNFIIDYNPVKNLELVCYIYHIYNLNTNINA